jgi:hypothetical protein
MFDSRSSLALLAAVAFATGATIFVLAVRLWRAFRAAPEVVLKHLLGRYLGGRAVYLCNGCNRVHIIPALQRHPDGTPDWSAPMSERDLIVPMQMLVHEGQPLQVIARRIGDREGLPFFGVLALLMTREERERALAALRGEARDELVDSIISADLRGPLKEALEERNAVEEAEGEGLFPAVLGDPLGANLGGAELQGEEVRAYVALLTPSERAHFRAALHEDQPGAGSVPSPATQSTTRSAA